MFCFVFFVLFCFVLFFSCAGSAAAPELLLVLCRIWDLSSLTRDGILLPRIGRQIPNHWTTRAIPTFCILIFLWLHCRAPSAVKAWHPNHWTTREFSIFCILRGAPKLGSPNTIPMNPPTKPHRRASGECSMCVFGHVLQLSQDSSGLGRGRGGG